MTTFSPRFLKAYRISMGHEGFYSDRASDRGGETYKGITRKNFPNLTLWKIIDKHKAIPGFPGNIDNKELEPEAQAFYHKRFWVDPGFDKIENENIALEMFDTGINMGAKRAIQFLQRTLNLVNRRARLYPNMLVDGILGPKSLSALNNHPKPTLIFDILNIMQGAHYIAIMENDESQEDNVGGWISRVDMIRNS